MPHCQRYPIGSWEELKALANARDATEHEGFVVTDRNFNRVKVKSASYVALSHLATNAGDSVNVSDRH